MNKNVWKSLKSENINRRNRTIMRKTLNKDQTIDYELLKKISVELILDNYDRNPTFEFIKKSINGYDIYKKCHFKHKKVCRWLININIDTNEAILSCNKECEHKNPIKYEG